MTRSLSTFRPTVKGLRLRTIFFCSLPCTNTSAGNTPDVELWLIPLLMPLMVINPFWDGRFAAALNFPTLVAESDYSDVTLACKMRDLLYIGVPQAQIAMRHRYQRPQRDRDGKVGQ